MWVAVVVLPIVLFALHEPTPNVWASATLAPAWSASIERFGLREYRVVDSGCWERLAPVPTRNTWHEFRVTVQRPDGDLIAKTLVVHTRAVGGAWAIADIEGFDL